MEIHANSTNLTAYQKKLFLVHSNKPALNTQALFSDGTEFYRSPSEPTKEDSITIRIRTAKQNVDRVILHYNEEEVLMKLAFSDEVFDFYETTLPPTEDEISYYFEIFSGTSYCCYHQRGVSKEKNVYYNFRIHPGFSTPDWAKGAVIYQIYVDRFCNGDKENDVVDDEYVYIGEPVKHVDNWEEYPSEMDVRRFYGGDLQGVMDKLDYLKDLGVEVIYFNPIFVSPSNHKYDIQDYDYVDPHFGKIVSDGGQVLEPGDKDNSHATKYIRRVTDKANLEASNQLFIELVEQIHARGMKVILDGVFNHCGSFNKWLDRERIYEQQEGYEKGAYVDENSPYHTFFQFYPDGNWPYNGKYDGWWGHDTLPKLNYEESETLVEYILRIAAKWVSPPYNVDGWRLDVAADLGHSETYNHQFWKAFRKTVKEANPNAIILAEHYGDPGNWLKGDEWDTVMNYDAFMEPITWFLTGMEKHSDEFRGDLLGNQEAFIGAMEHHMTRFHTNSLQVAMNELSNHDHSRFLTRTNRKVGRIQSLGPKAAEENINKGIFREAVVMQMTWVGAPTIYYGDEAGVCGWTDPDNRRTYPWGKEDKELIQFHKDIIAIHRESRALKTGSIKILFGMHRLIAYGRFLPDEQYVVIVNNGYESVNLEVPVWQLGIKKNAKMLRLMRTTEEGYDMTPEEYDVKNSMVWIEVGPISAIILKAEQECDNHNIHL